MRARPRLVRALGCLGLLAPLTGCGGSATVDGSSAPTCPPTGPFGTESGEVAPDVELHDCTGAPVRLHDLCAHTASYLYTFAAWCPSCQAAAASGAENALFAEYRDLGLAMWFVVTGTAGADRPDATYCQVVQDQYGLNMTVLYDSTGVTEAVLALRPNGDDLVLRQGAVIAIHGSALLSTVEDALDEIYGR